ncbi:MAG: hypothetical protein MJ252_12340 [archaeon]|nr:hypothetical protein [archaeon]
MVCDPGFCSVGGVCRECPKNCLEYDQEKNICYKCNSDNYFLTNEGTCEPCAEGCQHCTDKTTCKECYHFGYYLKKGGCSTCPTHCLQCDAGTCYKCEGKFYPSLFECKSCPSHCEKCSESGCEVCEEGYFMDGTTCKACNKNCAACDGNENKCTKCPKGFFLQNDVCKACGNGCIYCRDEGYCYKCDSTYTIGDVVPVCTYVAAASYLKVGFLLLMVLLF